MAITRTGMIDDDGSGTTGTILNNAWKQELYNQIDQTVGGVWTNEPFIAANFFGSGGMVWTVGAAAVIRNRYAIQGKTLFWSLYLSWFSGGNVLSGTPSPAIRINFPGGHTTPSSQALQSQVLDYCSGIAGVPTVAGLYGSNAAAHSLEIRKATGGNFAISDVPGMNFLITLEVG